MRARRTATAHAGRCLRLDAVTGRDRPDFERHLLACEQCREDVRGLREAAAHARVRGGRDAPPRATRADPAGSRADPRSCRSGRARCSRATARRAQRGARSWPVAAPGRRRGRGRARGGHGRSCIGAPREHRCRPDQASETRDCATVRHRPGRVDADRAGQTGGTATVVMSHQMRALVFTASRAAPLPATKGYELWLMGPSGAPPPACCPGTTACRAGDGRRPAPRRPGRAHGRAFGAARRSRPPARSCWSRWSDRLPRCGGPRQLRRPDDTRPAALTLGSVKASPEEQQRLLELAALDADLGRLEHRRRTLPEHEELTRLQERDGQLRDTLAALEAEDGDLRRAQVKAESDVEQVRSRIERDQKRLDAGQVSTPRELENLQSEIASLGRRQGDLEEIVLDLMERRETAQASRDAAAAERDGLAGTDRRGDRPPRRRPERDRRPGRGGGEEAGRGGRARSPPTCSRSTTSCAPSTPGWARLRCARAGARAATCRSAPPT